MALINPPRMPGVYGYRGGGYRGMGAPPLPRVRVPTPATPAYNFRGASPFRPMLAPTAYQAIHPPAAFGQQPANQYLTDDQIQAQAAARAKAIYDPLIQQIVDSINRRGQQGTADLAALTGEYAQAAQGYANAIPGIYGPAKQETLAAVTSLADRLKGEGSSSGQALNASLAQAGVQGPSDINLAQQGAGAGNAAYGTGIAELDRLIANQASAQTFAAGEPSRAFAGGQQQLGGYERYLANLLATQQGQLTAQIPGTAESIAQGIYARQGQQQQMDESKREFNVGQASNAAATAENQRRYNATTAENQRRYNESIARQTRLDRQTTATNWTNKLITLKGNKEAETGQQYRIVSKRPGVGGIQPVTDAQGHPVLTPAEKDRRLRAQATLENIKSARVARLESSTTVDPRTGQVVYTTGARKGLTRILGFDPGAGPATKTTAPRAPKVFGSGKTGYYTIDANGTVTRVTQPAKTAPKPINVSVADSQKTGVWRDTNGKALTPQQRAAYGLPPKPPPISKTGQNPALERQKAVKARGDAWSQARSGIYQDAKEIVNAHPGLGEGTPAWKQGYTTLLRKYRADVLRYTSQAGRRGAARQLDQWIRAALKQPGTARPTRAAGGKTKYPWAAPPKKTVP